MPLWLLSIFGWIKANPIQFIQALCVASLAALAVWFYFDYTGTKRENANLKTRVEQAESNYTAATKRINDFAAAQAKFQSDLEALSQSSIAIKSQVKEALAGLNASEIEREYRNSPAEAQSALDKRVADLFSMFERTTGTAPPQPR